MADYLQRAKFFRTKKRLGQNFLVNPEVIADIIDFADITKEDVVLEIGPGVGFVTEQLVRHAKKVIAIETTNVVQTAKPMLKNTKLNAKINNCIIPKVSS